jgi:30S ribosomal protein S31
MGKGDIKSKRGKITNGSYGNSRKRKVSGVVPAVKSAPTAKKESAEKTEAKKAPATKKAPAAKKTTKSE